METVEIRRYSLHLPFRHRDLTLLWTQLTVDVNLRELRRLLTARVHESIGRGHNRINMVRASLGRPWGRVNSGCVRTPRRRGGGVAEGGRLPLVGEVLRFEISGKVAA